MLGEFVVRDQIGHGGFGTVYRADQPSLGREVVIKVLRDDHRSDPQVVGRFMREAQLASRLEHPYAAHVYACGAEPDGTLWIAMELVRGTPLSRLLSSQGAIARERLVPFVDNLCEVVDAAHELGIVHRDIKPANVMVVPRSGRWWPKLLDFGVARGPAGDSRGRATDGDGESIDPVLTLDGTPVGSPAYMAPELWLDPATADRRADIYALGVVVFEALTGHVPFAASSRRELFDHHARGALPSLGDPAIDAVVARAMAKRPADRHATARELAVALRDACGIAAAVRPAGLDERLRDELVRHAPRPIAEAVAILDEAEGIHQTLAAIAQTTAIAVRWVTLVAVAATRDAISPARLAALDGDDQTWLDLAREVLHIYARDPVRFAIPELVSLVVDAAGDDSAWMRAASALCSDAAAVAAATAPESVASAAVARRMVQLAAVLRGFETLAHYRLAVPAEAGAPWDWSGARRGNARVDVAVALAAPALVDAFGRVAVDLELVARVAAPAPGAPDELFLLDGSGRHGARLVAWPARFELRDDELWRALGGEAEALTPAAGSPYPGLRPYTPREASRFVGRERDAEAFRNRLVTEPLLAVVGPSGSGKSSFVQAGVVGELDDDDWSAIVVRPGPDPVAILEHAIRHALRDATSTHVAIVVDQGEELFTQCRDDTARTRFAAAVVELARDRVHVVLVLRDDFLVRAARVFGGLARVIHILGTPGADELRRILVEPARRAGFAFEDGLVDEIVGEVGGTDGGLALLAYTASALWDRRDVENRKLTRASYEALGGVGGALSNHADATIATLPRAQASLARDAFRRLVTGEGTRAAFGRDELIEALGGGDDAHAVVERLVDARLLVASDGPDGARIEIVHEVLIRAWPQLTAWRAADVESSQLLAQLRAAARQWVERKRAPGLLWRGDAWDEVARWRTRHAGVTVSASETAFFDACAREARRHRRQIRGAAIAAAIVVMAVIAVLSWSERRASRAAHETGARLIAASREYGRRQLVEGDPAGALASLEAARVGAPDPALAFMLARAAGALTREVRVMAHGKHVVAVGFAGPRVLSASEDGSAIVWDETGARLRTFVTGDQLVSAAITRDGALVITGGQSAQLWDTRDGHRVWSDPRPANVVRFVDGDRRVATAGGGTLRLRDLASGREQTIDHVLDELATSADGKLVVAKQDGGRVIVIDAASGVVLGNVATGASNLDLHPIAVSHDDSKVAIALPNGTVQLVTVAGAPLATLAAHSERITSLAFSTDDRRLLTTSTDRQARAWDLATATIAYSLAGPEPITRGMFSPDGSLVLTVGGDGSPRLWDANDGTPLVTLDGHSATVEVAAFSADSGRVVTGSWDGTARLWTIATLPLARAIRTSDRRREPVERLWFARLAPDGKTAVTAEANGRVRLWDVATGALIRELAHLDCEAYSATFSSDGQRVAIASYDQRVRIVDARDGTLISTLTGHGGRVWKAELSPDGTRVVTASWDHTGAIYDASTGVRLARLDHRDIVWDATWSPDGKRVATASDDGTAILWDASTGRELVPLVGHTAGLSSVAWSADGKRVVTGSRDLTARTWDAATGRQLALMSGMPSFVNAVTFSADGAFVATAGFEGGARVWDAATGELLAAIDAHRSSINSIQLTPDGRFMLTAASYDARVKVWRVDLVATPPDRDAVTQLLDCRHRDCGAMPAFDSKR